MLDMRLFDSDHLPDHLKAVAKPFNELAGDIYDRWTETANMDPGVISELSVGLRHLLDAKDCIVRCAVLDKLNEEDASV